MPRQARLDVPGALHHIMVRGINKSKIFDDDQDKSKFLERLSVLVRYVHLNPVRAKILTTVEQLDRYPWSGHRVLIGKAKYPWMDTDYVLAQFATTEPKAQNEYRRFIREGLGQGHVPEFTGGGDFVENILKEAEDRQLRQLRYRRAGKTINKIIEEECAKHMVSIAEVGGGSKRQKVSATRAEIACRSREELGLTAAEIARHLGVNTSSITRTIERSAMQRWGIKSTVRNNIPDAAVNLPKKRSPFP